MVPQKQMHDGLVLQNSVDSLSRLTFVNSAHGCRPGNMGLTGVLYVIINSNLGHHCLRLTLFKGWPVYSSLFLLTCLPSLYWRVANITILPNQLLTSSRNSLSLALSLSPLSLYPSVSISALSLSLSLCCVVFDRKLTIGNVGRMHNE